MHKLETTGGWHSVPLRDVVVRFTNGGTPPTTKSEYWNGKIPWVTGADFIDGGLGKIRRYITDDAVKGSATNVIAKGDLLLVTRTGVGKMAIAPFDVAISQDITGITFKTDVVPAYAYWYLRLYIGRLKARNQGTSINGILRKDLEELPFLFPGKEQQRRIVAVLDCTDGSIGYTSVIVKNCYTIKKALMQTLLTIGLSDKSRTSTKQKSDRIQKEWKNICLGDIIQELEAGVSVNSEDRPINRGERGILKTGAVLDGVFKPSEHKSILTSELHRARITPKKGNLIISRMNTPDLVGEVGYVDCDCPDLFLPDRLWQTVFKKDVEVDPQWLAYLLASPRFKSLIKGAATGTSNSMKNIPKSVLLKLKISLPHYSEQKEIARRLSAIDNRINTEREKLRRTIIVQRALLQKLLSGEMKVN